MVLASAWLLVRISCLKAASSSAPSGDWTGEWVGPHLSCTRGATPRHATITAGRSRLAGYPASRAAWSGTDPLTCRLLGDRWAGGARRGGGFAGSATAAESRCPLPHRQPKPKGRRVASVVLRPPPRLAEAATALSRLQARPGAPEEVHAVSTRGRGGLHSLSRSLPLPLASDWPSGRRVLRVTIGGRWSRRGERRGEGPQL